MKNNNEPWQIKAARFCVEKSQTGFTANELRDFIQNECGVSHDNQFVRFYDNEIAQHMTEFAVRDGESLFQPTLEMVQRVMEYDELQLARRTSESADRNSKIAIGIALLTLAISALVELGWLNFLSTQEATALQTSCLHSQ